MKKFIFPLIVLLIAGIISAGLYFTINEKAKTWQTTDGIITSVKITDGNARSIGGKGPNIHYEWIYTVDGIEYSGKESFGYSNQGVHYKIGEQKEIWYNPKNPVETSFHKPSPNLAVWIPLFMAIPIMLAVYSIQARKENKSLR